MADEDKNQKLKYDFFDGEELPEEKPKEETPEEREEREMDELVVVAPRDRYRDMAMAIVAASVVLLGVLVFWVLSVNRLTLTAIHPQLASSRGIPVGLSQTLFTVAIAVVVTLTISSVGLLILNSLLVLPGAAARNVAKNLRQYHGFSVLFALLAGLGRACRVLLFRLLCGSGHQPAAYPYLRRNLPPAKNEGLSHGCDHSANCPNAQRLFHQIRHSPAERPGGTAALHHRVRAGIPHPRCPAGH